MVSVATLRFILDTGVFLGLEFQKFLPKPKLNTNANINNSRTSGLTVIRDREEPDLGGAPVSSLGGFEVERW